MVDQRVGWEVDYNMRVAFASTYLRYLRVSGAEKTRLQQFYGVDDDLCSWAKERITGILDSAEQLRGGRSLSTPALTVVAPYAKSLAEAGFGGVSKLRIP